MKIDIHAHEFPTALLKEFETLIKRGVLPRPDFKLRPWNIDEHMEVMNEKGVDLQVLSLAITGYPADREGALALSQAANDSFAEACRKHPDRFISFAALPLTDVEASIRELRRAVDELGMKGVILGTNVQGEPIDGEALFPLYEEINRFKLPILIHPMDPKGPAQAYEYRLDLWIGWPTDTALAAARLVLSGMLDRFPDMTLILSHLGGSTHYLLGRIGNVPTFHLERTKDGNLSIRRSTASRIFPFPRKRKRTSSAGMPGSCWGFEPVHGELIISA
jgi:predicted TIM-barrel fold metal-dependent hydrolase